MKKIPWWRCKLNKDASFKAQYAIENECLSDGAIGRRLEERICKILGTKYCVVTTSGTSALLLSMICCNVKRNTNVIVPAASWISTAHAPAILGCDLRFADVSEETGLIKNDQIISLIDDHTKAVIAVHLNGNNALSKKTKDEISKKGVMLVEDSCQAFMSRDEQGNYIGRDSQISCYSFGVTKLLTCGQGGCLTTSSKEIYESAKLIKNNGLESIVTPHYTNIGLNLKHSDILSSILLNELDYAEDYATKVTEIYNYYKSNVNNKRIIFPMRTNNSLPLYTQVKVNKKDRNNLISYAKSKGIELREIPSAYTNAKYLCSESDKSLYYGAEEYSKSRLYLPSGPKIESEELQYICNTLNEWR